MKLGRNDLCWCGSEKKYKKCHMAADEAKARAESAITTLGQWVSHHGGSLIERVKIAAADAEGVAEAKATLFGDAAPEDPFSDVHFLELAAFDHPVTTPLIRTAPTDGDADDLTTLANTLGGSFLSLMEVIESKPGKGIRLKDRMTGYERFVWEADMCTQLEPLEVIVGRVIVLDKRSVLLDGWEKVAFRGRKKAIADVNAWIAEAGVSEDDAVGKAGWLKRNAARVVARARAATPQ